MTAAVRAVAGVLTGGLVVLALALVVAAVVAGRDAMPGPGAATVLGHAVVAAAAVLLQRRADTGDGVAGAGVVLLGGAALVLLWL